MKKVDVYRFDKNGQKYIEYYVKADNVAFNIVDNKVNIFAPPKDRYLGYKVCRTVELNEKLAEKINNFVARKSTLDNDIKSFQKQIINQVVNETITPSVEQVKTQAIDTDGVKEVTTNDPNIRHWHAEKPGFVMDYWAGSWSW